MDTDSPFENFLRDLEIVLYGQPDVLEVKIENRPELLGYNIRVWYEKANAQSSYDLQFHEMAEAIQSGEQTRLLREIAVEFARSYNELLRLSADDQL